MQLLLLFDEIATEANFFCFGTNDLTQTGHLILRIVPVLPGVNCRSV